MKLNRLELLILSAVFLTTLPFLGGVHLFDWDEINFAEMAREMRVTGEFFRVSIDFKPFWEKPPLFIWLQALSMSVWGINEFAARFPNAIIGAITVCVLYRRGVSLLSSRFGFLWAASFACSFLPNFYMRTGIIDPLFNLFIFLGIDQLANLHAQRLGFRPLSRKSMIDFSPLVLAGLWVGLGILTKGPVALLMVGLTFLGLSIWEWKTHRRLPRVRKGDIPLFLGVVLFLSSIWFLPETLFHNPRFLSDFFGYQVRLFQTSDAGHKGFPGYHFVVVFLGCFPSSVFAVWQLLDRGSIQMGKRFSEMTAYRRWMVVLLFATLGLFSIVGTKIVHYSSLSYLPISFLSAFALESLLAGRRRWSRGLTLGIGCIGLCFVLIFVALPLLGEWREDLASFVKNDFAKGNLLADVPWGGQWMVGVFFALGIGVSLFRFQRQRWIQGLYWLFGSCFLIVPLLMWAIVPLVEMHTQRAAIEFYEGLRGRDVYAESLGYKSFAPLFYARKSLPTHPQANDLNWLLLGKIDKDAYFSVKKPKAQWYLFNYKHKGLELLYEKNGFVFLKRPAK